MGARHMESSTSTRVNRSGGTPSVIGLIRLLLRLTPRQLNDEVSLAREQLKQKGITAGVAAAFFAVALVFVAFLVVALIVAAIMGLGTIMPPWLAALCFAALFLIIAAIAGLMGLSRFKKALPLLPEDAIRGVKYDIGVLKEGRKFNPATLDVQKPKEEKKPKQKDTGEPKPPAPSYAELRSRSGRRRDHIAETREDLGRGLDFKSRFGGTTARARQAAAQAKSSAVHARDARRTRSGTASATHAHAAHAPARHTQTLADRWKPLSVVAASAAAIAVMVRRLVAK
ncbi:Putative Holin-X, holin superfamily III [Arthrobacter subterraneus]|uniref:Putative Holin-X, holin superfamily III n=1 Tax=Arthrobacter subterraneus TaxID=335973 RepID=A0A1G8GH89_9MICC|nr:phage holin family protein [Arthrobacter subterraneus]SDH93769.1 Putative Holin-X, holin superfamily III [Arthrobacter subterraneus]